MANGAFSTNVIANGVDLSTSDHRILMRIVRGLDELPDVRGKDIVVPGLPGRIARNRVNDRLVIEAAGFVAGTGADETAQRADFRAIVDEVRALMDPTQNPYTIEATLEDGAGRTITARPVNIVWGDDNIPSFRMLSCEWESIDPDWTAQP